MKRNEDTKTNEFLFPKKYLNFGHLNLKTSETIQSQIVIATKSV